MLIMSNKIDGLSMNLEQANLDKLRSVFPECVSEGKLDCLVIPVSVRLAKSESAVLERS